MGMLQHPVARIKKIMVEKSYILKCSSSAAGKREISNDCQGIPPFQHSAIPENTAIIKQGGKTGQQRLPANGGTADEGSCKGKSQ